jgi:hypothetical protein
MSGHEVVRDQSADYDRPMTLRSQFASAARSASCV